MGPALSSICFSQGKQHGPDLTSAQLRYHQMRAKGDLPPNPLHWEPNYFYALTQGDQVSRPALNKVTSHGSGRDALKITEPVADMSFDLLFGEPT